MKLKSELKRVEQQFKVPSHHAVEGEGNAEVFELSLDELNYVAGGSLPIDSHIKIEF